MKLVAQKKPIFIVYEDNIERQIKSCVKKKSRKAKE